MHPRPRQILVSAAALIVALLAVFAWLIVSTGQQGRADLEARFADRASDAAGSVQALFLGASATARERNSQLFGGEIDQTALDRQAQQGRSLFLAVLDGDGSVLAIDSRAPARAREHLESRPAAVAAVMAGAPLYAGDLVDGVAGEAPIVDYVTAFPAGGDSQRMLATGVRLDVLQIFLGEFLARAPNPAETRAMVVDGAGRVVGGPRATPGAAVEPQLVAALREGSEGEWRRGRRFTSVPVPGTSWRVVLDASTASLYAPVGGARRAVPWLIFTAFLAASLAAWLLLRRALLAAVAISSARDRLAAANAELVERAGELERSNRDLEEFAAIASHDLREPLRSVQAFGDQLERRYGEALEGTGLELLTRMRAASSRMEALIDDLLALSRLSTRGPAFTRVELDEVVAEVLEDLQVVIAESGAAVSVGRLPTLEADPLQMRQLVQNLVSNAIKFRKPGVAPEVRIEGTVERSEAVLRVSDNGIGFDPRHAEQIFGAFKRLHTKTAYPGTGIGLALCRKIVERHGGTIEAIGVEDEGSIFIIRLPVSHGGDDGPGGGSGRFGGPASRRQIVAA